MPFSTYRLVHHKRRTVDSIARYLPRGTQVLGAAAGLHVVIRVPGNGDTEGPAPVVAAARHGVGIYPLAPLFASAPQRSDRQRTGPILGYASLTIPQIEAGEQRLNDAVSQVVARPPIRRKA
jgi:GntR family transcriptional regulator/MocR family aminotransferase